MRSFSRGFTLIELTVTTAIVSILAFVAVPAYRDYQRHSQATAGVAQLAAFRQQMETYYQDHLSYAAPQFAGIHPDCGVSVPSSLRFTFKCTTASAGQGFTLVATGTAGAVEGSVYRIDQSGLQTTTMFKGKVVSSRCWLLQGTECGTHGKASTAVASL